MFAFIYFQVTGFIKNELKIHYYVATKGKNYVKDDRWYAIGPQDVEKKI